MGIRNQKVGNVLILVSFRNGLPRRPVGPPRNDRLFRQSKTAVEKAAVFSSIDAILKTLYNTDIDNHHFKFSSYIGQY